MDIIAVVLAVYVAGAVINAARYRRIVGGSVANVIMVYVGIFWPITIFEN